MLAPQQTNKAAMRSIFADGFASVGPDLGEMSGADDHSDRGPRHNESRGLSLTSALEVNSGTGRGGALGQGGNF